MGTSESRPLELIYGQFLQALETGDVECALDLMAMAALATRTTPGLHPRRIARRGVASPERADVRGDQAFEVAAWSFGVKSSVPLASALPCDVGASMARRLGWIYAWRELIRCDPDATSDSEALNRYFKALSDFAEFPFLFESSSEFVRLADEVEKELSGDRPQFGGPPIKATGSLEGDLADDEDGFENETRLVDEFETFLENGETMQALNLLAVSFYSTSSSEPDAEAMAELVAKSEDVIRDEWDDSTEIDNLLSRLWVTAYYQLSEEIAADNTAVDLGLPRYEPKELVLSDAQQRIVQAALQEFKATATQSNQCGEVDDEAEGVDEEADAPESENLEEAKAPPASVNLRSSLVGAALRHLNQSCGADSSYNVLAERSVEAAHQIWAAHATITASWKSQISDSPGYGGRIQTDLGRWADSLAAETYPLPVDNRPTPQKRGRRVYESVWAWTITAGILAAGTGVHEGFWFMVGLGAFIGYLLSSNYDSITAPRLTPLPDAAAEARSKLQKALYEIGVHVALKYDSEEYASNLTPSELRRLVNGAWQPQSPPPPRMTSCTHREAEYVAAQWMRYLGATSCRVTQASRDGGMDIVSDTHVAEVKHHQSPVGVNFVRQIYGAATGASKQALFFSLSEFTRAAEEFANANSIPLFRYNPQEGTLTAKSRSALLVLQRGLHSGMDDFANR